MLDNNPTHSKLLEKGLRIISRHTGHSLWIASGGSVTNWQTNPPSSWLVIASVGTNFLWHKIDTDLGGVSQILHLNIIHLHIYLLCWCSKTQTFCIISNWASKEKAILVTNWVDVAKFKSIIVSKANSVILFRKDALHTVHLLYYAAECKLII